LIETDLVDVQLPESYEGNDFIKTPVELFVGYLIFDCWSLSPSFSLLARSM